MRSVKCGTEAAAVQSRTSAAAGGVRVQVTTGATAGRRVSADVSTASCRLYRRRTGTERCTRRRRRQHGFRRNFSSRWSVTKPRRSSARVIGCRANPRCARADDEGPSMSPPAPPLSDPCRTANCTSGRCFHHPDSRRRRSRYRQRLLNNVITSQLEPEKNSKNLAATLMLELECTIKPSTTRPGHQTCTHNFKWRNFRVNRLQKKNECCR